MRLGTLSNLARCVEVRRCGNKILVQIVGSGEYALIPESDVTWLSNPILEKGSFNQEEEIENGVDWYAGSSSELVLRFWDKVNESRWTELSPEEFELMRGFFLIAFHEVASECMRRQMKEKKV